MFAQWLGGDGEAHSSQLALQSKDGLFYVPGQLYLLLRGADRLFCRSLEGGNLIRSLPDRGVLCSLSLQIPLPLQGLCPLNFGFRLRPFQGGLLSPLLLLSQFLNQLLPCGPGDQVVIGPAKLLILRLRRLCDLLLAGVGDFGRLRCLLQLLHFRESVVGILQGVVGFEDGAQAGLPPLGLPFGHLQNSVPVLSLNIGDFLENSLFNDLRGYPICLGECLGNGVGKRLFQLITLGCLQNRP